MCEGTRDRAELRLNRVAFRSNSGFSGFDIFMIIALQQRSAGLYSRFWNQTRHISHVVHILHLRQYVFVRVTMFARAV